MAAEQEHIFDRLRNAALKKVSGTFSILQWLIPSPVSEKVPDTFFVLLLPGGTHG